MKTTEEREDIELIATLPYQWDIIKNKTILISGGTGFIGSFLIDVIRYRNEHFASNTHIISMSRHGGVSDDTVTSMVADVTKPIDLKTNVDFVLHLASNTHPKQYASDPIGTILTNIIGCDNLLKLAVDHHATRFLLASSVEIYGEGSIEPMDEYYCGYIDCNNARAGYNESKRTCEALVQAYRDSCGIDAVIIRLARTFGPDAKRDTKAISQFFEKAINDEDIILKSKGNQRYSYIYVADAASGILKVLLDGKNGEAYNVAADYDNHTLKEYAEMIAGFAGRKVVVACEENSSVSKAVNAIMKCDKIKDIGWKSCYTVSNAMERTYKIYKTRHICK